MYTKNLKEIISILGYMVNGEDIFKEYTSMRLRGFLFEKVGITETHLC